MSDKIKVAYMLGSLNRGGTETLMLDTFGRKNLLPECVCIYRKTGVFEKEFQYAGVRMLRITPVKNIFAYFKTLRQVLRREQINIVHAQQPIDALYVFLACLGLNIKIALTLHGYDFSTGKMGKIILKFILPRTTANIYVSQHVKDYYSKKYNLKSERQFVIYNGVSFSKIIEKDINNKSLRQELKITENKILLGMVGNFVPGREPMTVCRFLKLLSESQKSFHFVFVGKKSDTHPEIYEDSVKYCKENGLTDKVTFLGSRNDVPAILSQLDAFIYSTDHDTFGIAVVEAMAAGIPVFVNDWPVMNEITEDGKYATIYQTKNEEDLFQKISNFLQNKETYSIKTKQSSEYVRNTFSIQNHIAELNKLYKSLNCLNTHNS
ncbi:MAG: glycosyltransferase family 1 protein [Bacteroidia bacterium]|jgi:glycosyltransferase involved in cell wall biosynthesis|nr:glycosyltransferase family 1 protein [Bacteroidia bacterium]